MTLNLAVTLKAVRERRGYNKAQLAKLLGVSPTAMGQYESGSNLPTTENLIRLGKILKYDFINGIDKEGNTSAADLRSPAPVEYIARKGEGDIVRPPGKIITSSNAGRRKEEALIPFYNADFMAGRAELFYEDGTIHPEYYMDVPEFAGCTAFRAYSDSMEKLIRSGSILFGTKVEDWRSHLEYGQIYGITCSDGRRYLKYIRKAEDRARFLLRSENPDYDDFEMPIDKISNIWLIEGWLDKRA